MFLVLLMLYILHSFFVRLCSDASDFNKRNIFWTAMLLKHMENSVKCFLNYITDTQS